MRSCLGRATVGLAACVAIGFGVGSTGGSAGGIGTATALPRHGLVSLVAPATEFHSVQSSNWSGYDKGLLDTGSPAQSISGEWTVPTATQHTAGQAEASATWVGVGGGCVDMTSGCAVTDPTLIQAGTEQDVSASGQTSYSAWWEVLPAPSVTGSIPVHPGDLMRVSITGPVVWTIDVQDLSDGQSFTETVPYPSTMDSAEWVEEAPVVVSTGSLSAGEAALPNLSTVGFQDATLNGAGAGLTPAYEMQMVDSSGQVLATPSAPGPAGNSFNVCAYATSCPAP